MFNEGQVAGAVGFRYGGALPASLSLQESFGDHINWFIRNTWKVKFSSWFNPSWQLSPTDNCSLPHQQDRAENPKSKRENS